jgi:hypothetical protein
MSIVYVIGAGASYGEKFSARDSRKPYSSTPPPITTGFFSKDLLNQLNQDIQAIEKEFKQLLNWTRLTCMKTGEQQFGEGEWETLNIEDVFTNLDIAREFESPEGRRGAQLLLVRNELLDYIRRIIGLCTTNSVGVYCYELVKNLRPDDSLITFNWDLLLDDCFLTQPRGLPQYENFLRKMGELDDDEAVWTSIPGDGILLKMHGSLNWFQCTNPICAGAARIIFRDNTESCLKWSVGSVRYLCQRCGSDSSPLIIPPVIGKRITEQETVKAVWGHARNVLENANVIVIVGFSVPPTDFYAAWLLRNAVISQNMTGYLSGREKTIIVVDPLNDTSNQKIPNDFKMRMSKIFPQGYNSDFTTFSQINDICKKAVECDPSERRELNPSIV